MIDFLYVELFSPFSTGDGSGLAPTYGWWVGRTFQPMYYWGGAAPGSRKCACGLLETNCDAGSLTCNCDAGLAAQTSDKGYLEHKEYLPVLELHFGDTGTVTDKKIGYHLLNELLCEGDSKCLRVGSSINRLMC